MLYYGAIGGSNSRAAEHPVSGGHMKSPYRIFLASLLGATLFAAAAAHAEKVFPVNDNNTGLFDQPSVAMNGSVAHVAFIGDNTGTGYRVYYAAVNGGADFTNV